MIKKNIFLGSLVATSALYPLNGCLQQSEKAPEAAMAPSQSTPAPVTSTVSNFIQQVSATNLTTTAVVAAPAPVPAAIEVPAAATNQVASAVSPNGQLLERAKALSADQKYMEAASLLGTVNSQDLTGEEKSLWQSLQAQVRKALAAETAKSASDSAAKSGGGLFGK